MELEWFVRNEVKLGWKGYESTFEMTQTTEGRLIGKHTVVYISKGTLQL